MRSCETRGVGAARSPPRVWARVGRGGLRRLAPVGRRPSRAVLPALARSHARPGAVDLEPRLVDRLRGAPVLSARLRLPGGGAPLPGARASPAGGGLSAAPLDRLPGSRRHHVPLPRATAVELLARPARRLRGAHRLGGDDERRRGRGADRHDCGPARVGPRAAARPVARPLGRGRRRATGLRRAGARRDRARASRAPPGGRPLSGTRRRRGPRLHALPPLPGRLARAHRRPLHRVLDRAVARSPHRVAGARLGRPRRGDPAAPPGDGAAPGRAARPRGRRPAPSPRSPGRAADGLPSRHAPRDRPRSIEPPAGQPPGRQPRHGHDPRCRSGDRQRPRTRARTLEGVGRGRARGRRRRLARPGRPVAADPPGARPLARSGRVADAGRGRAGAAAARALGGAQDGAGGTRPLRALGRAARRRHRVVSTAHPRHRAHAAPRRPRDRQRHVHPPLADRGPRVHGIGRLRTDHPARRATRRREPLRPAARVPRRRGARSLRHGARREHDRHARDRRGPRPTGRGPPRGRTRRSGGRRL